MICWWGKHVFQGNDALAATRAGPSSSWQVYRLDHVESPNPILTIGYGSRTAEEFVGLLLDAGVEHLVDVRSAPYSRFRPEFSREPLAGSLGARGIRYVFMGDALGGRPDDPGCYDQDGHVDYTACRLRPAFAAGVERLEVGHEAGHRIALMCSEGRPQDCHRTKLVAEELVRLGVPVVHIDAQGDHRPHAEVVAILTGGQETLFGHDPAVGRLRGRYRVA